MKNVSAPMLHLGGTSYRDLYEQYTEAIDALRVAQDKLRAAAPHQRDYVNWKTGEYQVALASHYLRITRLSQVLRQMEALREDICKQNDARQRMVLR